MTSTLFIIQIVLAILITIAVLMQKSSSIGLGAYSGSNESLFGAKGPAGFLTKMTFILAFLFVGNTLALGYFYSKDSTKSAVDTVKQSTPELNNTKPLLPAAPATTKTIKVDSGAKANNTTVPKAPVVNTTTEANTTK